MKKIAFVLVVLLFAAPALALVTITAEQVGDTNEVNITYVTNGNLPRAFGLDVTVDYGVITACTPAMVGECTASVQGYGIFPGTIQIDGGGDVTDDGTPVAPFDDPGALLGIDSNGITLEMGSLYVDGNEPDVSGVLCTITVSEDCTVSIAGNAARCGTGSVAKGVVMENPDEVPDVNYVEGTVTIGGVVLCAGDVTATVTGYTPPSPFPLPDGTPASFDSSLWEGPDGKVDLIDLQSVTYLLVWDGGTTYVVDPVPAEAAAADVTGTVTGYTPPSPFPLPDGTPASFDSGLWTGADGKVDLIDLQSLIYLLVWDGGTEYVVTCP